MRHALFLSALLLLAPGCNDGGGSDDSPTPQGGSSPGGAASSGGTGGIAGVTPGTPATGLTFAAGDATSRYAIYVPSTYSGSPVGVVLALHGVEGSANPTSWFQVCVLYANEDRFIIVAPYGDTNDGGSGAWCQPFGRPILDHVRAKYNVDNARQYVAAISGGCYPAIWLALASGPPTYQNYCGDTVASGFQSDFAAVGFSAPAYTPSSPDYTSMQSKTAADLGFTPALWADYGQNSSDGPRAQALGTWGTARGYAPVTVVARPGEGHAPQSPFSFVRQMFDFFAANPK